jgi:phage terminase small subunit
MTVLHRPQWEEACQIYVLEGTTKTEAWAREYPKVAARAYPNSQHVQACKLFARPEMKVRVEELGELKLSTANSKFEVDAAYVLGRLVDIDRMDVLDIMEDEGSLKPVKEWPMIWRNFIQQFEIEEVFAGRGDERLQIGLLKKIKWPDKVKNLELLGKHIDISAFRVNIGVTGGDGGPVRTITTEMTAQEAAEAYADTLNNK